MCGVVVFIVVGIVVVVGCGFGGVVGGREGENTESRWFSDEERRGGAGICRIGGGLGFRAAGVALGLGLGLVEGDGGCAEEEEEG